MAGRVAGRIVVLAALAGMVATVLVVIGFLSGPFDPGPLRLLLVAGGIASMGLLSREPVPARSLREH